MISARTLVAASIKDRAAFDTVRASPEPDAFTGELLTVWSTLCDYYARDPEANVASPDNLMALALPNVANPKGRKRLQELIGELGDTPASPDNVREACAVVRRERTGTRLAVALAGKKAREEVDALITEWQETWTPVEDEKEMTFADALASRNDNTARMIVYPLRLNKALKGGVFPGHHIIIFARPERGKTTAAITMAAGFAKRGHKVLYLGNEDPAADLMTRAVTAFTKRLQHEVTGETLDAALRAGLGNLKFLDIAPGSLVEIEALVRRHRPAVLVVDQLRNIHAGKTENLTQRLDAVAQGLRSIAKRYGLVAVSVTQAGDSARDKAILDDGDIDSSNTGIPAAADVLLGIGATPAMLSEGSIMMTLCKNKVGRIHEHFTVRIDQNLSLVRSFET